MNETIRPLLNPVKSQIIEASLQLVEYEKALPLPSQSAITRTLYRSKQRSQRTNATDDRHFEIPDYFKFVFSVAVNKIQILSNNKNLDAFKLLNTI